MDQLTPETVRLLRAVLMEADVLRYTRPDDDPLLKDLHSKIKALRKQMPGFDIHPGWPPGTRGYGRAS